MKYIDLNEVHTLDFIGVCLDCRRFLLVVKNLFQNSGDLSESSYLSRIVYATLNFKCWTIYVYLWVNISKCKCRCIKSEAPRHLFYSWTYKEKTCLLKKKRVKFWIGFLSHICDDCAVRLGVAFALNLDYRPSDQHHMIEKPIQNLFYVLLFHVIFRVILFIVSRHALEDIKRKVVRPEAVIEPGTLRSVGKCDNHCVMVSCIIYTLA